MPTSPAITPGPRRPGGVNRLGVAMGAVATAGTLAVAFLGLGGPPAQAAATADTTARDPAGQQVVVKTVYVQLPSPTATPTPATPKAPPAVVTRQSGSGGEGGENEGND